MTQEHEWELTEDEAADVTEAWRTSPKPDALTTYFVRAAQAKLARWLIANGDSEKTSRLRPSQVQMLYIENSAWLELCRELGVSDG